MPNNDNIQKKEIIINESNINDVSLNGFIIPVDKKPSVDGKKVQFVLNMQMDKLNLKDIITAAANHYAKNWYNNNRPSNDEDLMSKDEAQRRKNYFLRSDGKTIAVDASSIGSGKKQRQISLNDLAKLIKQEKDESIKQVYITMFKEKRKELLEAEDAIKDLL